MNTPRATPAYRLALRNIHYAAREMLNRALVRTRWISRRSKRPAHGLSGQLVVTLTSYPPRFSTLHLTLQCLLTQSIRPDAVVLWVAEADSALLPEKVLRLRSEGLSIRTCDDLGSYKKLIPALSAYPDAYLTTADDDIYYWPTWLEELVAAASLDGPLPCHRAHRIGRRKDGGIEEYMRWDKNIAEASGEDVFPTTGLGVLYPPSSLGQNVGDVALFQALCPTADDIWLYWMARLAGRTFRKIGRPRHFREWRGSQSTSLFAINGLTNRNDVQMGAIMTHFGVS